MLRILEPNHEAVGPPWLVPAVEIALLGALIAANPGHLEGRARWLRPVSITLIGALAVVAFWDTAILVAALIRGTAVTNPAASLLTSGALIWLGNALIFGLLYWSLDGGGPLARYRGDHPYPDFAFLSSSALNLRRLDGAPVMSTTSCWASPRVRRSVRPM